MPFFQKAKPRQATKRKFEPNKKKAKLQRRGQQSKKSAEDEAPPRDSDASVDSDSELEEARDAPDRSESEDERETAEEKKLRLAKLYLDEIEREERDRERVSDRLRDDYLEHKGRLRRRLADTYAVPEPAAIKVLRCKDVRLSITCLCVSADGRYLFSGTKCSALVKWSLADMKKLKSVVFRKGKAKSKDDKFEFHSTPVGAVAVTTDGRYLASCDRTSDIQIWNAETMEHLRTFKGHRARVNDLAFRKDSHQLFSASDDRSVKVWSLDEMAYVETAFGHQCGVTSIDALAKERAVTAGGRDRTVRIWKIVEESQLIFNGHAGSVDGVRLLGEEHFVTCGDDGALCVWGSGKKRPLCSVREAHGAVQDPHGAIEGAVPRWVVSVAAPLHADAFASGSHDGKLRVWRLAEDYKRVEPLLEVPLPGFVNALAFTPDGTKIVAGVGQEHRLARWWCDKGAKNAIYVIPLTESLENR